MGLFQLLDRGFRCRRGGGESLLRHLHLRLDGRAEGGRGDAPQRGAARPWAGLRAVRPRRGLPPDGTHQLRRFDLRDLGSLLNGSRLAVMEGGAALAEEIGEAVRDYEVTTLWLTAGLFHLMVDEELESLQRVR